MSGVVGILVALAVLTAAASGARRHLGSAPGRSLHPAPRTRRATLDLSAILVGVSAQLRAGATPHDAWSRTLVSAAGGPVRGLAAGMPVPDVDVLLAATSCSRRRGASRTAGQAQRVRAVVAATRLSDELGAPLAGVLDRIATAVAADEEAEGERQAALAGPRSTAQVLAWLPLLGVALGALLGADPVGVVLGGGLGTASAVLGGVLLGVGRWWTAALLARAGRAGDPRPARGTGDTSPGRTVGGTTPRRQTGDARPARR